VNLLLDTHIVLWWLNDSEELSKRTRAAIEEADRVVVSAVTAWEVAIKSAIGKLRMPGNFEEALAVYRFESLPLTVKHGLAAGALNRYHGDPFDRMLVAQASLESLTLVTRDRQLAEYGVAILLA
jgi:PIN domain nuclease of toxin-antitoxin system